MLAIPEQECAVCLRQCGARDATRAGGRASRVSQATCSSGGRQPLRAGNWCRRRRPTCGVVGGCCSSWRRAAMEGSALGGGLFSPRRTCTPLHSQVSQTLPFARHWTNALHLRLSDSLQSSRFMRSALCVARAWYWMDNPLNAILRPVSAPSAAKLARSSLHPFFTARRVAEPAAD